MNTTAGVTDGVVNPASASFCLLQEAARTETKSKSCGRVLCPTPTRPASMTSDFYFNSRVLESSRPCLVPPVGHF